MGKEIGFSILGYGMAARMHARAFQYVKGAKLLAVTGRNIDKARDFAREFGIEAMPLEAVLENEAIKAVIICTPTGSHLDCARKLARAGKHLLVEKPLESNLQRSKQLINVCEECGVSLGAVFQHRYDEASQLIKEYQQKGLLGKPLLGSAYIKWYRNEEYYQERPWRASLAGAGGGALATQGSHTIDLLLWFLGKPQAVCGFAETLKHSIEVEDTAVATIKFKNGALGTIEASTATYPGFPERLELHFERGSAIIEGGNLTYLKTDTEEIDDLEKREVGASGASNPEAVDILPFSRMIQAFVDALKEGKKPELDGVEGSRAVELIEAIRKSALERKIVYFE